MPQLVSVSWKVKFLTESFLQNPNICPLFVCYFDDHEYVDFLIKWSYLKPDLSGTDTIYITSTKSVTQTFRLDVSFIWFSSVILAFYLHVCFAWSSSGCLESDYSTAWVIIVWFTTCSRALLKCEMAPESCRVQVKATWTRAKKNT